MLSQSTQFADRPVRNGTHTEVDPRTEGLILAHTEFIMAGHLGDGGLIDAIRSFTVKEVEMRKYIISSIIGWILLSVVSPLRPATTRPPVFTPVFDAKNFPHSTTINNRYFPLVPGTTFVYEATQGAREHDEFVVTSDTKNILGVDCVVGLGTACV